MVLALMVLLAAAASKKISVFCQGWCVREDGRPTKAPTDKPMGPELGK